MLNALKNIRWPTAVVVVAAIAAVVLTLIYAPAERLAPLLAGEGIIGVAIAGYMRSMRAGAELVLLVLGLAAASSTLTACGPLSQSDRETGHNVLNGVTDVADPTYRLIVDTCDDLRDRIVEREDSTQAEDEADMEETNHVCDAAVEGMEGLRSSQLSAREGIDNGLPAAMETAVRQVLTEHWPAVQRTAARIWARVTSGGDDGNR